MSDGMLGRLPLSAVRGPRDTLDEHLAGKDGEIVLAELNKFNAKKPCWVSEGNASSQVSKPRLLTVVATTRLSRVAGKATKDCFVGLCYVYRDPNFDNWLPANQSKAGTCSISTLAPSKEWTFIEAAQAVLGVSTTDAAKLGRLLIEQGHTMTLTQVEGMIEATERHEETGIRTNGYGNFFFVETGNPNDPVSVAYVLRDERWYAFVYRLVYSSRLDAGYRILVRNLLTL